MDITLDTIRDLQLYQSATGYRFSVDSLLLFSFVNLVAVRKIADLGAGTGIIGLLLAKKYPHAQVSLIELQDGLMKLAQKNILLNNLEPRVNAMHGDLRDISGLTLGKGFDLVVSNPPFRRAKSGRLNSDEERAVARHEIKLKLADLITAAYSLLREKGRLCIIYHPGRIGELLVSLKGKGIEVKRLRFVHSDRLSEAKMVLVEAVRGGKPGVKVEKPFYIYQDGGNYTEEMQQIYST
jgi:tRNA1Val (adenine37-N6)-methyltransferase